MLKYDMDMGLYFAAIKNSKLAADGDLIPKLVAGYKGKAGNFTYNAGIGFQKYEIPAAAATVDSTVTDDQGNVIIISEAAAATTAEDVSSYVLWLCGDFKAGSMTFLYGLHYGQNLGDYGILGRSDSADYAGGKDSTGYGGMLEMDVAGWAFGVGYTADELDIAGASNDAQMAVFANYTAQIAKGFKIVPEITYLNLMDDAAGDDEGDAILVGAKFQMDF